MDLRFISVCLLLGAALSGCGLKLGFPDLEVQKSGRKLVVSTTNYQSGALALLDIENRLARLNFAPIFSDAIVKSFPENPDIFVINRLGADNIQRIDRNTGKTLQQFSLGLGTNPQDMVLVGENAYITCYQIPELYKINLATGNVISRISLNAYSDVDGSPEATKMILKGSELWIQLQRLDKKNSFLPTGLSQVVVLDTTTDLITQVVNLKGTNPVTAFKELANGQWLVADAGTVGSESPDGGIELLDPNKKESQGFITTETQLGGDLVDFECINSDECLAIISKPETELVLFDVKTGIKLRSIWQSSGYDLRQIMRDPDSGLVYVADGNAQDPKIRVWSESKLQQELFLNWNLQLPPYQMDFLK